LSWFFIYILATRQVETDPQAENILYQCNKSSILSPALLTNIKPDLTHVSFVSLSVVYSVTVVSKKLERMWKDTLWSDLKCCLGLVPGGLKKAYMKKEVVLAYFWAESRIWSRNDMHAATVFGEVLLLACDQQGLKVWTVSCINF
jgi:hypothetical protein